ncbi:MAG: hypothetical protein KDH20_05515 [Rhodocyclaceae bacterium]|nr:hypothetical protein [Rhodocyclaceae bacterium]
MGNSGMRGAALFVAICAFMMAVKQYYIPSDLVSGGQTFYWLRVFSEMGGRWGLPLFFSGVGVLALLVWYVDSHRK